MQRSKYRNLGRDIVPNVLLFFSSSFLIFFALRAHSPLGPWGHGPSREHLLSARLAGTLALQEYAHSLHGQRPTDCLGQAYEKFLVAESFRVFSNTFLIPLYRRALLHGFV